MAVTKALIDTIAPELAGLTSEQMAPWIEEAGLQVNREAFGDALADRAQAYFAAHLMATSVPSVKGAGRVVKSASVGPVSQTFVTSAGSGAGTVLADDLASTRFGVRFLAMSAHLGVGVL